MLVGTNDYFDVMSVDSSKVIAILTDRVADNIAALITELAELGAKRFLVISSADIAPLPAVAAEGHPDRAAEFQTLMHSKLSSRVDELEAQFETEITLFDLVALSTEVRENPSDYGLSNVTDACQPVLYGIQSSCASMDEYYFWDEGHPTRRVHEIVGEAWAALSGK